MHIKRKSILAMFMAAILSVSIFGCEKKDKAEAETTTEAVISTEDNTSVLSTATDPAMSVTEYTEAKDDPTSAEAVEEQKKFDEYLDESYRESVVSDTVSLHYSLAYPEKIGIEMDEVTYGDGYTGEATFVEAKQETLDAISELKAYNYELLTTDQKFTYDILMESLETDLLSYNNPYLYEPFAYTSGLHVNLPITMSEYKFYDKEDVEDYIKLLELMPDYFESWLSFEREKSDKGFFMAQNSTDEVIRQCNEFIADPEKNLLIETFNARIGDVEGITPEEIESYKQANHDAVINQVIPTYEKVIDTFNELRSTCKNELGLSHLEGGKDYYIYLLKSKVGTELTPEEVITRLDSEIDTVMDELISLAMLNSDDYMAYFDEYENFYSDIDPKDTIIYFEEAFEDRFPEIPEIDFTISPVHESLVDMVSPAFYMTPPLDAYEDNVIHTNMGSDGAGSLWSTLAHEGVPGHMYQFVYFLSNDPNPLRTLLNFNGYQEGWATYVEYKSFDYYDGYSKKCFADMERINSQLNILVSARIEIGVNYEGWTVEETANYLTQAGFDGSVAQDIFDYVIAEPANYQMYCTGWLEFERLREMAEEQLGGKFNERVFHQVVLDAGPCQFKFVEQKVQKYIDAVK
ncbi:MAG: DUF885 domain-containing protein [Clostridium sp.]|nr:DUF885 domain-containing protein [Clostridium sp.]MCM1173204.1 DUF885 domain-containing protein [Clostridium sp.]MCM1208319.1 DUF885 domain-containing protein [Ruminococcus sp.]